MACTVADAERMLRAAEGAKQVLAVGLLRRFFLSCQSIKRFISLKLLGQPQSFCFSEGARFNWPVESAALFDKETAGGGILIDIGSHALDLMQWWFGTPARLRYRDDAMGGVEATCLVHIEYDSGLHGKILLSRDYQLTNTYSLEFEKGVITWRVGDVNHIQVDVRATDVRLKCEVQQLSQSEGTDYETRSFPQSVTAQLTNVIESIQQTQQLVVPASEGLKSLQLIEKCYANRELLDMPWLTTEELTIGRQCAASSLC
jgi:predicted dehydrogenase